MVWSAALSASRLTTTAAGTADSGGASSWALLESLWLRSDPRTERDWRKQRWRDFQRFCWQYFCVLFCAPAKANMIKLTGNLTKRMLHIRSKNLRWIFWKQNLPYWIWSSIQQENNITDSLLLKGCYYETAAHCLQDKKIPAASLPDFYLCMPLFL